MLTRRHARLGCRAGDDAALYELHDEAAELRDRGSGCTTRAEA
jgi:hypothetical protein